MTDPTQEQRARWLAELDGRCGTDEHGNYIIDKGWYFDLCATITAEAVEAERERLIKSTRCVWAHDSESAWSDPMDALDAADYGEICELEHVAVVKTEYAVILPSWLEDGDPESPDKDDNWVFSAPTKSEVETALAAENARRSAVVEARKDKTND